MGTVSAISFFRETPRLRRLESGEEERLLAACSPHLRSLLVAALETYCRIGELLSLQWRQVRWEQNEIYLPDPKTKAHRARFLPMSQRLQAELQMRQHASDGTLLPPDAYVFGNELGERVKSINTAWRAARRRAKVTGLTFHDLRREAGSRLLESGVFGEHYVQRFLDHASLATTSRYLSTTRVGLQRAMRQYDESRNRCNLVAITPKDTESQPHSPSPPDDDNSFRTNGLS